MLEATEADVSQTVILFSLLLGNRAWHFIQIVSSGDNLNEMSNSVFMETKQKNLKVLSARTES